MIEIIIGVLGISILLYVLLGGADFGGGIVELFTGKKGSDTISKAIAPVWEANHIWLILAVVILLNGFPRVYTTLTLYLHIPIFIVLIGIIFRGTAFTFRYYDTIKDNSPLYYTRIFRLSSLITPFFLGVTLGAIVLGRIPANVNGTFYEVFIWPWFNFFTCATGIFVTVLCGWLAAVYLIGEAADDEAYRSFAKIARNFFVLLVLSGLGIFILAEIYELHLFSRFINSLVASGCIVLATIIIPLIGRNIRLRNNLLIRLLAGVQTTCIILGWFAVQFPVMIYISGGSNLTVWNSQAPELTISLLVYALIVGIIIILPAFFYLFKVFKFENKENQTTI